MSMLIECVPNFSEGRDKARVDAIVAAMLREGVYLLDSEMDADHNRSVVTLVGERGPLLEAALAGIGKAAELIDLNVQRGAHPRLGATDVVPFIPIEGATLDDCVQMARELGEQVWQHYRIPVYFYEAAATRPERANLENIRRGQSTTSICRPPKSRSLKRSPRPSASPAADCAQSRPLGWRCADRRRSR